MNKEIAIKGEYYSLIDGGRVTSDDFVLNDLDIEPATIVAIYLRSPSKRQSAVSKFLFGTMYTELVVKTNDFLLAAMRFPGSKEQTTAESIFDALFIHNYVRLYAVFLMKDRVYICH